MTATLLEAHDAIAGQIDSVLGVYLRVNAFPPQTVSPPAAWVAFDLGGDQTMGRGVNSYTFNVYVVTGAMGDRAGYTALISYLDPEGEQSIRAAITAGNSDGSYNGLAGVNVAAIDVRSLGMEELGEFSGYGAVFPVTVTITKG